MVLFCSNLGKQIRTSCNRKFNWLYDYKPKKEKEKERATLMNNSAIRNLFEISCISSIIQFLTILAAVQHSSYK